MGEDWCKDTSVDSRRSDDGNRSSGDDLIVRIDHRTLSTSSAVTRENLVSAWSDVLTAGVEYRMGL